MEILGKDLLVEIVNFLELEDVLNFSLSCKKIYKCIAENENFWKRRSMKEFSVVAEKEKYISIWKEVKENNKLLPHYLSNKDQLFWNAPIRGVKLFSNKILVQENLSLTDTFVFYILYEKLNNRYTWHNEMREEVEKILKDTEYENKISDSQDINKEEILIYKNLIYKSLSQENTPHAKFENAIKQYVYLGLLPLNPKSTDLHIPIFFRL